MPSIETHISCESTCPVEFKNGFGEIVEFRPSGKRPKTMFWGVVYLIKFHFTAIKSTFCNQILIQMGHLHNRFSILL